MKEGEGSNVQKWQHFQSTLTELLKISPCLVQLKNLVSKEQIMAD